MEHTIRINMDIDQTQSALEALWVYANGRQTIASLRPYHTAQERRLYKRVNLPIGQGYYQSRHGRVYRMMATGRGMEKRYVKGCVGCGVVNRLLGWLPKGARKGIAGVVALGLAWVAGMEVAR